MYSFMYIMPEFFIFMFSMLLLFSISFSKNLNLKKNKFLKILEYLFFFLFLYSLIFFLFLYLKIIKSPMLMSSCFMICLYSYFIKVMIFLFFFIFMYMMKNYFIFLMSNLPNEFFFFLLISCFFMCLIMSSFNLFFLFLCLEGLTLSSIVMICLIDYKLKSLETILNYFFISAVSSVFFILGMTILFLDNKLSFCFSSFSMGLENKMELNNFLDSNSNMEFLILIGILFIFVFFFMKLGFFPFHFWVPKFFNSIWFLMVFFLVLIKLVFISIFFSIMGFFCFFSMHNFFLMMFYICSLGSMMVGCIGAFYCNNLKYFIAFTSMNNLGYLFMGFSTNNYVSTYFSFLFFLVYFLNFIIFFISLIFMKYFENFNKNIFLNGMYFTKLNNFIKYNKNNFLNFIILFSFFSISGLPPFAIFSMKMDLLNQIWLNGNYLMVIMSLFTSFFSMFYYFSLIKFLIKEK